MGLRDAWGHDGDAGLVTLFYDINEYGYKQGLFHMGSILCYKCRLREDYRSSIISPAGFPE